MTAFGVLRLLGVLLNAIVYVSAFENKGHVSAVLVNDEP